MRDRAPQESDFALSWQQHVGNETAAPLKIARIFLARNARANALSSHDLRPSMTFLQPNVFPVRNNAYSRHNNPTTPGCATDVFESRRRQGQHTSEKTAIAQK